MHFPDLDSPREIGELVRIFYTRVAEDPLLGPVFVRQAQVDWDEHQHTLTAFWSKLELGLPGYFGSPTEKHAALSAVRPFRAVQFERWIALFHDTIDSGWEGPHAESIKARATQIAKLQSRLVPGAEPYGATPG